MTTKAHPLLSWSPEAVVFDCDGTLMDTERHWQDARSQVFRQFGLRPLPGFAERAKGVHYGELTESLLTHFMELVADDPVTMPGAAEFVRRLSGRLPLAVASNCPLEVVEMSLERAGLLHHFCHVVVPDEPSTGAAPGSATVRPKPWPDVYARAAWLCGADPDSTLAVEDSLTGIESARRAGLRVLGVGPRPGEEDASRADLWVTTLHSPVLLAWVRAHVPQQGGSAEG
ncbi:HAD family hydrolase [Streptomyces sp. SM8]|uniref:HAD family hydrolase n=1 Tax=Streptomyces sp. SM8 TaxID=1195457 RepID=UPI000C2AB627|nr:HAD family phosphatase [Streptomyces sp. SM8]PKA37121.1 hydrolase [Streptomyces sp. SM8]